MQLIRLTCCPNDVATRLSPLRGKRKKVVGPAQSAEGGGERAGPTNSVHRSLDPGLRWYGYSEKRLF